MTPATTETVDNHAVRVPENKKNDEDIDIMEGTTNTNDEEGAPVPTNNKNCCTSSSRCDVYQGNVDAMGLSWLAIGRGMLIMSNIFLVTALLWLAKNAAGCDMTVPSDTTKVDACDKSIHGMKADTFITNIGK